MGKSLSLDIRERVVALVNEGLSCHEAAGRLRISAASTVWIMQRRRQTGGVKAAPRGRPRQSGCASGSAPRGTNGSTAGCQECALSRTGWSISTKRL